MVTTKSNDSGFAWQFSYGDDNYVGPLVFGQTTSLALLSASFLGYYLVVAVAKRTKIFNSFLKFKQLHNIALSLYSGVTALFIFGVMFSENHFTSLRIACCKPIEHPYFEYFSFAFLLSKLWEWVDTILLVKKGKDLRFVHQFHHATTFWLYAVNNTFKSSAKYGVGANALVHFIMYAHYAKPFPPAFRKMITQIQIVQFLTAIFIHSMIYVYQCDPYLNSHFYEFITPYTLIIPYLILFLNFYVQQYLKRGSKRKEKSK